MSARDEAAGAEVAGDEVAGDEVAGDEVARFAALLRELKERTDRSYGSLARRLGMNTSTLHRYCAGEAVPVDFAPVERFAALCGASPEERLDLHRRWLGAVEARRRPRGGGAPEGATDGRTSSTPAEPARPELARPEPVLQSAPRTDAPARTDARPEPPTQRGREADAGVVSGPVVAGVRRARPWYRRKRVALAVACAGLAVVGSLSALPDGQRSGADAVRPTGVPAADESGSGPHRRQAPPSSSPSASPGPSRPDGGAAPSGARRTPAASGRPAPAGEASSPAGLPLAWTVDSQAWRSGCGHDYVIGRPPERVPPPPAPQDAGAWAAAQRAVHGRETLVELTVQGTSDTAVVLTALRVRVVGRDDPAPGNAYAMDNGCGGSITPRSFEVDLDEDRPLARAVAGNDAGTPIPAVRLPYRVSAKDPEVLLVTARTASCDCRWYLELDWSSQGRTGTVRVDDRGRPFRTSAIDGLPHYEYDTSARRWRPRTG